MSSHCLPLTQPSNQWSYCPSTPLAVVFFVLFAATTLIHIFQAIAHRQPFCWVIIVGGLWETCSFALRVISIRNETHKGLYDGSFLLLIISPLLINAFDYMLLGRMVQAFLPEKAKLFGVKGTVMGVLFVCCDILSFIIQIGGGIISLSKTLKTANLGLHVLTSGMIFQQLLIACFMALTIRFTQRLKLNIIDRSMTHDARRMTHVIRASLILITYRIVFRIIEFSTTQNSPMNIYISHHEFFPYVFDALPIFLALVLMNVWHPGRKVLGNDRKIRRRKVEAGLLMHVPTVRNPNNAGVRAWD